MDKQQIDWIKSIKDKVQSKREILEKLEEWLDEYVSDLADVDTSSLICSFTNYLDGKLPKSIRPKSQWKPSEEQIEAIKDAIEFLGCTKKVREDLKSLYEQMKKLRDE